MNFLLIMQVLSNVFSGIYHLLLVTSYEISIINCMHYVLVFDLSKTISAPKCYILVNY